MSEADTFAMIVNGLFPASSHSEEARHLPLCGSRASPTVRKPTHDPILIILGIYVPVHPVRLLVG